MSKSKKRGKPTKTLMIIAVLLLLVIIGLILVLFPTSKFKSQTILLDTKPTLIGEFIKNPDIIHSSSGWLSATPENLASSDPTVLNVSSDWKGDGYMLQLVGRANERPKEGVAVMHPVSRYNGRYIEQSVSLPNGDASYMLNLGIANIGDVLAGFEGSCVDVGIRVKITSNGKTDVVFDKIVQNGRWYDYSIDLGYEFSGNSLTVRVESYAADGGCGFWNAEYAAVDYIDIVSE